MYGDADPVFRSPPLLRNSPKRGSTAPHVGIFRLVLCKQVLETRNEENDMIEVIRWDLSRNHGRQGFSVYRSRWRLSEILV
ncbi:hypothetical protein KC19_7G065100 [Ceratodon purpureus]|uniref:Uncharacterized protein n=1 Tax=Ceratodon purpureus TaxID=3225 RepID=A0A8T0H585_CERPU|nr:hypothetical protein KC19_7G065100 [Ceratodon purpureus]